ncbi:MAG: hypothetical protein ACQEUT_01860 [Bacillota bacterium]
MDWESAMGMCSKMAGGAVFSAKRLSEAFLEAAQRLHQDGHPIENPDLFVYNLKEAFFAEVKEAPFHAAGV